MTILEFLIGPEPFCYWCCWVRSTEKFNFSLFSTNTQLLQDSWGLCFYCHCVCGAAKV